MAWPSLLIDNDFDCRNEPSSLNASSSKKQWMPEALARTLRSPCGAVHAS
jgi:hypothetical protein